MGRSAQVIWQLRRQDVLVAHASGWGATQVPRPQCVQGSTVGMKGNFHEHHQLCTVRRVVTK